MSADLRSTAGSVASGVLAITLLALGIVLGSADDVSLEAFAASALLTSGAFGFGAWSAASLGAERVTTVLGLRRPRLPSWRIAWLALGLAALSLCIGFALEVAGLRHNSAIGRIDALVSGASPTQLIALALCVAIAPGIGEELLFRGFALHTLSRRLGVLRGAVLSSLFFGLVHVDPVHVAATCLLGGYLAALRIASKSTIATMVCHAFNNAIALWLGARGELAPAPAVLLAIATIIACVAVIDLNRLLRAASTRDEHDGIGQKGQTSIFRP